MTSFSQPQRGSAAAVSASERMMRKPQRVTTTINWQLHQRLQAQADEQGRSLSGLIAYVLEHATA